MNHLILASLIAVSLTSSLDCQAFPIKAHATDFCVAPDICVEKGSAKRFMRHFGLPPPPQTTEPYSQICLELKNGYLLGTFSEQAKASAQLLALDFSYRPLPECTRPAKALKNASLNIKHFPLGTSQKHVIDKLGVADEKWTINPAHDIRSEETAFIYSGAGSANEFIMYVFKDGRLIRALGSNSP